MDEFMLNRYRAMQSLICESEVHDKVCLELGAGSNPITSGIECKRHIWVDIRKEAKPHIVCDLVHGIPLVDNSVDLVVAGEILEHIARSRYFFEEIRRVVVSGGELILSVPNVVSLKYRFSFLIGRLPAHAAKADYTYDSDSPTVEWGHVRDYSFRDLCAVLEDNGFRVIKRKSIGMHWKGKRVIPPWCMPISFSDNIIVKAVVCK